MLQMGVQPSEDLLQFSKLLLLLFHQNYDIIASVDAAGKLESAQSSPNVRPDRTRLFGAPKEFQIQTVCQVLMHNLIDCCR